MMPKRYTVAFFLVATMPFLNGGCVGATEPKTRVVYDLVEIFPLATSRLEVKDLRLDLAGEETAPSEPSSEGTARDRNLRKIASVLGSKSTAFGARIDTEAGELRIPFGTRVDYFLRLPPGSALAMDGVRMRDNLARLTVLLQRQGEKEEEVLTKVTGPAGPFAIPITSDRHSIARISFRALSGDDAAPSQGEVILSRPVLRGVWPERGDRERRAPATTREEQRPNVIIYLIDALRADRLGCYGHDRPVSPNIDAFAREGLRLENAMAQAPLTISAVSSVFTGVYPDTHGVTRYPRVLPADLLTMAEILQRLGYRTAAFTTNPSVGELFGLDRGFSDFVLLPVFGDRRNIHALSDQVNKKVFAWMETHQNDPDPFFLYVHTTDPHSPYTPSPEFLKKIGGGPMDLDLGTRDSLRKDVQRADPPAAKLIRDVMMLYEGEIAFNDHHFGRFVEELRRRGEYENSIIVLLSDHGEEFYEHGAWEHGSSLHMESLNIPLIVKFPAIEARAPEGGEGAARRVDVVAQQPELVPREVDVAAHERDLLPQQVDILPTILGALGVKIPKQVEGRDLRAPMRPGDDFAPRRGFAYSDMGGRVGVSIVEGRWKLIHGKMDDNSRETLELFDLRLDPGEKRNLAAEAPVVLGYLQAGLRAREVRGALFEAGESDIDDELRKQLKALGYLD